MAKYAGQRLIEAGEGRSALKTTDERTVTHEGADAHAKDAHTELFTLAVNSMTAENTFYETAVERDRHLRGLVHQLASEDPGFIQKLVPWLRNTANMRSVPIVIAAEYALAQGPNRRQVINSAMSRADEPAEFIGYYMQRTGRRTLPAGIQRGVADAVQRLYTEWGALKYDSGRHAVRMGDVIELTHPQASIPAQGDLYEWLLAKRHHPSDVRANVERLLTIKSRLYLEKLAPEHRRDMVVGGNWTDHARNAEVTWEWLSGWLPGGMDAEAWEAVIPEMRYMALLRNLRNFDEAGISAQARAYVKEVLEKPSNVEASRQFPYRFWSAWNATQSVEWGATLEAALKLSCQNIPEFDGTTIVFVDVSGSMINGELSAKSQVKRSDVAGLFGAAVFEKNPETTRVVKFGTAAMDVTPSRGASVLRIMERLRQNEDLGHGTFLSGAVDQHYRGEDRVVVFTDDQAHDGGAAGRARFTHYFDLAGYRAVPDPIGVNGTFMYGGFTDATFRHMKLNEVARTSDWDSILS